jgi:hypothetical protein
MSDPEWDDPNRAELDAREMPCTMLQRCEYGAVGDEPVVHVDLMQRVTNFWVEIERRGEDHVFSCAGIYPTGYDRDGSPQFTGEVCAFGDDIDSNEPT